MELHHRHLMDTWNARWVGRIEQTVLDEPKLTEPPARTELVEHVVEPVSAPVLRQGSVRPWPGSAEAM